jgi:hypothetical protein
LLALVLVLIGGAGCAERIARWKQGEPVQFPAEAVEFDDLKLLIDRDGDDLTFKVRCMAATDYRELEVRVHTEDQVDAATYTIAPAEEENVVTCGPGRVHLEGRVPVFETLETGESLQVQLEFERPDGFGASKAHVYMLGTDGQLRDGGGSVWK